MKPRRGAARLWRLWLLPTIALVVLSLFFQHRRTSTVLNDGARIAYFIQVSAASLPLLNRLLLTIYDPSNFYALHLDLKIDELKALESMRSAYHMLSLRWGVGSERNVPNLLIVRSEIVTYRGATMTMNYLTGANRLLAAGDWDYFINLSGSDYPTAPQKAIRRLLGKVGKGRNFVEWKPQKTWMGFAEKRFGEFYVDTGLAKLKNSTSEFVNLNGMEVSKKVKGVENPMNPLFRELDFTIAKSSGWFILSREFCEHLRDDSDARKLLALLAFSDASDEHYFASVLWNADDRWRGSVVNSNMRSIFFVAPNGSFAMGEDGRRSRQHPFWVDEAGENGGFLFGKHLKKSPGFFTRKVRGDGEFRDWMDREMMEKEYEERLEKRFDQVVMEADRVRGLH